MKRDYADKSARAFFLRRSILFKLEVDFAVWKRFTNHLPFSRASAASRALHPGPDLM